MTRFRPCIDLHDGRVKQIVGSSLTDDGRALKTNFVSDRDSSWFARQYWQDNTPGGHVIMLGPGNEKAALWALAGFPGGLQVGGGISAANARQYLDAGASHVIVTSNLFDKEGKFLQSRLDALLAVIPKERLVIDLSCKATAGGWVVAMNRWQTITNLELSPETLATLASQCAEFLIHAVDVEGKCEGIDEPLVRFLGEYSPIPVTYAGGVSSIDDLWRIQDASDGRVDATIGSALDMFGGTGVKYSDCIAFNRRDQTAVPPGPTCCA
ncbi:MAG: phosphoribosylformimino-5-aminoimidazole carboxamide ribotide isomerase [Verrucomicrobiales bacterium]|nr:phosphoribosylformimino-5-aminoimidazole carboxamide ribotide isomerase [Verrucomicrobiales bacterium]MCP5559413.1 phosphoribosylformimino-5-aminoimidazole carboxamide ribotide isomerase [Verrucomicrobiaceae bacterium]